MPCINANKAELRQIAARFISHLNRIFSWEELVGLCSKRGGATFIPAPWRGRDVSNVKKHASENGIWAVIKWAKTARGGKVEAPDTDDHNPSMCSSAYGLCE